MVDLSAPAFQMNKLNILKNEIKLLLFTEEWKFPKLTSFTHKALVLDVSMKFEDLALLVGGDKDAQMAGGG